MGQCYPVAAVDFNQEQFVYSCEREWNILLPKELI